MCTCGGQLSPGLREPSLTQRLELCLQTTVQGEELALQQTTEGGARHVPHLQRGMRVGDGSEEAVRRIETDK